MKPVPCTLGFKLHFLYNISLSYIAFNAVLHLTLQQFNQVRSCHTLSPSELFIIPLDTKYDHEGPFTFISIYKTNKQFPISMDKRAQTSFVLVCLSAPNQTQMSNNMFLMTVSLKSSSSSTYIHARIFKRYSGYVFYL